MDLPLPSPFLVQHVALPSWRLLGLEIARRVSLTGSDGLTWCEGQQNDLVEWVVYARFRSLGMEESKDNGQRKIYHRAQGDDGCLCA